MRSNHAKGEKTKTSPQNGQKYWPYDLHTPPILQRDTFLPKKAVYDLLFGPPPSQKGV